MELTDFGLCLGGDGHGVTLHGFARQLEVALGQVEFFFEVLVTPYYNKSNTERTDCSLHSYL